ncbi:MAG: hypothetical protein NDI62_00740 [Burkholderiales bacterium]|nr:hypothetical protein [Burkholderiales bacterium]
MSTKIKLLIVGTVTLLGIFANGNVVSAQTVTSCNSATLTGTVTTGTPPTHARFTYSTSYSTVANGAGTITPVQYFNTEGTFPIQQYISGLSENTTYYFRLEVTNNYGTAYLNILNFTTSTCTVVNQPVNGGWSAWSDWSPKSTQCGYSGVQTRTRSCNNPTPAYGGAYCSGPSTETQTYTNSACLVPVNGGWSDWSTRDYACGTSGTQTRTCTNPTPANGGAYCSGPSTQSYTNPACVVNNPTVSLTVDGKSNTTITAGQSVNLAWNSSNADSCSASWMYGGGTTNGNQTVNPTSNTTYNITCYGGGKSTSASAIVYVTAIPSQMSGTLTGSSYCTIPLNGNGCNTTITWNTTNPKGISSVTSSYPYDGSTIANRNYGSQSVFIPFSSRNFYLYNNGELLDTKIITSSCASNTQWDGTKCANTVINQPINGGWSDWSTRDYACGTSGTQTRTCTNPTPANGGAYCSGPSTQTYTNPQCYSQNPTVSISADNTNVNYGNSTTLRWNSNNATSCVATSNNSNYWYGSVNLSGTWNTGMLTTPTTYTITCSGANNTSPAVSSVTVYVTNNNHDCSYYNNCNNYTQAPIINLSANSTYITSGSGAYLTWNPTNNPTYCTASNGGNNWAGSRSTYNGSFSTGALYYTTVYTMTCGNSAGSTTESVVININNQNYNNIYQPNVTLTADSTSVAYGGSTNIRWYPTNATSCYANSGSNGWAGTKSTYSNSFHTGALTNTTTYNITCSNNNGNADTKSVTVYVGNQNQPSGNDPYVSLNADEESLSYNGATYLRWTSQNATSCVASGGSTGWSGTKSIGPASFYTGSLTSGKTYKITCSNSYGYASDTVTIGVRGQTINNPKPAPTSLVLITSSVDRNQPIVPTIDNTRPKPGDEINYTVNYQNIGTGSITKLNLRMDLPYEVDYIFSNPNNPTRSGSTLIFNLGTLGANKEGTVTVRVRVRENIPAGTNLNFPAILSYTDPSGYTQSVSANVSAQVWSQPVVVEQPINTTEPIQLGALAFLFGNGFLPNNLIGWLLLILLVVLLVLAARKAYSNYNREVVFVADNSKKEHH